MSRVVIYGRVSTNDQTTDNQIYKLKEIIENRNWNLVDTYTDEGISGSKGRDKRLEFNRLCEDMVKGKFDKILVWDVSRLGRSLQDLVMFLNDLNSVDVGLYIHQSGLDTSTPSGRMMFQMVGVFSEFERSMISERVKSGLERVKKQGKKLGRKPTITSEIKDNILELLNEGKPYSYIANELNVSKATVCRLKKAS